MRSPKRSRTTLFNGTFRDLLQLCPRPQNTPFFAGAPSGKTSFSENDVNGTTHRLSTPSHRRQCGEDTLRTFVTPGSEFRPFNAKTGEGMPQRARDSSRTPSGALRTRAVRNSRGICRAGRGDCPSSHTSRRRGRGLPAGPSTGNRGCTLDKPSPRA